MSELLIAIKIILYYFRIKDDFPISKISMPIFKELPQPCLMTVGGYGFFPKTPAAALMAQGHSNDLTLV